LPTPSKKAAKKKEVEPRISTTGDEAAHDMKIRARPADDARRRLAAGPASGLNRFGGKGCHWAEPIPPEFGCSVQRRNACARRPGLQPNAGSRQADMVVERD